MRLSREGSAHPFDFHERRIHATVTLVASTYWGGLPFNFKREPDPRKPGAEYVIGIGDSLRVNVWKNAELSGPAIVRPDGTITMALIGDIKARGRTPTQLKREISTRLKKFLATIPPVTIAVTQVRSYRFTVSGQVARGGQFAPRKYVTISEAMALAGGVTRFADANETVLIRRRRGKILRIPICWKQIVTGKRPDMDLVMLAGDRLHVP